MVEEGVTEIVSYDHLEPPPGREVGVGVVVISVMSISIDDNKNKNTPKNIHNLHEYTLD